jgi:hypothetical protein
MVREDLSGGGVDPHTTTEYGMGAEEPTTIGKGASMTKTHSWVFAGVSAFALIVGVLLATGAVTFAQTDEPTPTPSASGNGDDGSSPTPKSSEDAGKPGGCGGGHYALKEAAAEVLGISEDDLRAALRDGQSLAQIAEAHGMSVDDFKTALVDKVTADLQAKLDAGDITQEQFDARVADLNANIDEIINAQGGLRFHERGGSEESGTGTRFRGFLPRLRVAEGT